MLSHADLFSLLASGLPQLQSFSHEFPECEPDAVGVVQDTTVLPQLTYVQVAQVSLASVSVRAPHVQSLIFQRTQWAPEMQPLLARLLSLRCLEIGFTGSALPLDLLEALATLPHFETLSLFVRKEQEPLRLYLSMLAILVASPSWVAIRLLHVNADPLWSQEELDPAFAAIDLTRLRHFRIYSKKQTFRLVERSPETGRFEPCAKLIEE